MITVLHFLDYNLTLLTWLHTNIHPVYFSLNFYMSWYSHPILSTLQHFCPSIFVVSGHDLNSSIITVIFYFFRIFLKTSFCRGNKVFPIGTKTKTNSFLCLFKLAETAYRADIFLLQTGRDLEKKTS